MTDAGAEQPKAGSKIHDRLGVRLFTPPPEGFKPVEATERELWKHGFPARPDVRIHPELHGLWKQMMSQPITLIQPQFDVVPGWYRDHRQAVDPPRVAPTGGDGWCGSAEYLPDGDVVTAVWGQWTVPHVLAPDELTRCGCAEWVGIDGYNGVSIDILQAGTTQWITPDGREPEAFAWFEWYPAPRTWDDQQSPRLAR
jgi:hypothetical protein